MPGDIKTKKDKKKENQPDDEDEDTKDGLTGKIMDEEDDDMDDDMDTDDVEIEAEMEGPGMDENVLQSTGAMITKLEIFVSFLQIYGIIFNFDLTINWPINFQLFNMYFMVLPTFFLMDLSFLIDAFGFEIPADYFVYIKYIGTIFAFFMICISYALFKGWSRRRFVIYGIKKWKQSTRKYNNIVILLILLSAIVAIGMEGTKSSGPMYLYFDSGGKRGSGPTTRSWVWFLFFTFVILFLYLFIRIAFWIMRRSYFKDKTEEKTEFQIFFSRTKRSLQKLALR